MSTIIFPELCDCGQQSSLHSQPYLFKWKVPWNSFTSGSILENVAETYMETGYGTCWLQEKLCFTIATDEHRC